jgi:hypothetical protein
MTGIERRLNALRLLDEVAYQRANLSSPHPLAPMDGKAAATITGGLDQLEAFALMELDQCGIPEGGA